VSPSVGQVAPAPGVALQRPELDARPPAAVGNYAFFTETQLEALGAPTTLNVSSDQDTVSPVLQALTFSPLQVDTSSASATVIAIGHVTDNRSGLNYG
jgi:hypothetical protein